MPLGQLGDRADHAERRRTPRCGLLEGCSRPNVATAGQAAPDQLWRGEAGPQVHAPEQRPVSGHGHEARLRSASPCRRCRRVLPAAIPLDRHCQRSQPSPIPVATTGSNLELLRHCLSQRPCLQAGGTAETPSILDGRSAARQGAADRSGLCPATGRRQARPGSHQHPASPGGVGACRCQAGASPRMAPLRAVLMVERSDTLELLPARREPTRTRPLPSGAQAGLRQPQLRPSGPGGGRRWHEAKGFRGRGIRLF